MKWGKLAGAFVQRVGGGGVVVQSRRRRGQRPPATGAWLADLWLRALSTMLPGGDIYFRPAAPKDACVDASVPLTGARTRPRKGAGLSEHRPIREPQRHGAARRGEPTFPLTLRGFPSRRYPHVAALLREMKRT